MLGAPHFLKLLIAHALSVAGGSEEGLQTAGSVLQDVGSLFRSLGKNAAGFVVFGFEMLGVWHRMLGVWHDLLGVRHRMLGVGEGKLTF